MSDEVMVRRPGSIVLRLGIIDEPTPTNNPVTGETAEVSIRRLSDDKWFNFSSLAWDTVADYASLTANHKGSLTGKADGTYERDWDQTLYDGGVNREYLCYYKVTSAGDYENKVEFGLLIVESEAGFGERTFTFTVEDELSNALSGAVVHVRSASGGQDIRRQTSEVDGEAVFGLDDGPYYAQATLNGYTHAEEAFTVSSSSLTKTLTMASFSVEDAIAGAIRVYAWPHDLAGQVDAGTTPPLFTAVLSTPCLTDSGVLVKELIEATLHADGYWYVDLLGTDDLTAVNGKTTVKWYFEPVNGKRMCKTVTSATTTPINLIDLPDC